MGIEFGGREREERSIAGDEGERGKSKERAKGWSVGLILPPQSGAASDSICFKYMDRKVWAVAPTARDDTRREREKGSRGRGVGYDTRCILRENRPALLSRLPLQTGEDGDRRGMRRERERERRNNPVIRHNSFSSVFPSFRSQYSAPPTLGYSRTNLPSSSSSSPRPNLFSNLPAARYRLPNKLTECSAPRLPPVSLSWFPSRIGSVSAQTEPPSPAIFHATPHFSAQITRTIICRERPLSKSRGSRGRDVYQSRTGSG